MSNCKNYTYSDFMNLINPTTPNLPKTNNNQYLQNSNPISNTTSKSFYTNMEIDMNHPNELKPTPKPQTEKIPEEKRIHTLAPTDHPQRIDPVASANHPFYPMHNYPQQHYMGYPPIAQYQPQYTQQIYPPQPPLSHPPAQVNPQLDYPKNPLQQQEYIEFKTKNGKVIKFKSKKEKKPKIQLKE